jgi:hypothetical protein
MSQNEILAFQRKLAVHTAPSLLGIKCASLLSVSRADCDIEANARLFNRRAAVKGLKIHTLCENGSRALMLVYNKRRLSARLKSPECRQLLRNYGYSDRMSLGEYLDRLSSRIRSEPEFPHEIGIFLDYPIEDVVGFIENNGCNFKLCGYWKVYGNAEKAARTFEEYNKCRGFLCGKLNQGEDLYRTIRCCNYS